MSTRIGLIVSSLAFTLAPAAARAQPGPAKFTYVAIPNLPGGTYTSPGGINQANQVVGYGDVADGSTHGFIYDAARHTMRELGEGYPSAINDHGVAVGQNASGGAAFFLGKQTYSLGALQGELGSFATSINNEGVAVGLAELPGRSFQLVGYFFGFAFPIDLGSTAEIYVGINPVINDDFIVSGTLILTDQAVFRAFRHDLLTGETTVLAPIGGDTDSWGLGVNARGEVLGYSFVFNQDENVGTWDRHGTFTVHFGEGTTQYPTLSNNLVFNDLDQIVISETTDLDSYIVPSVGRRYNLGPLVSNLPATPQPLFDVVGINNTEYMTGYGFDENFNQVGFVLVPLDQNGGH